MNDRMHELYAAACLYARDKQLDRKSEDKDIPEFVECMAEKFAELIVRECVKVVDDMADPEDSERYFWAIQNASKKIKQHFGVEE